MRKRKTNNVIRKIAKREGIKESEVRREMQRAIRAGYMNTGTRQEWDNIFGTGRLPSPEEFITKVSKLWV